MYVELHTASAFSFLQGASLPEALVDRAAELGYSALALLDRDGVYGAPRFHKAALAAGIRPIIGAELTVRAAEPGGSQDRAGRAGGAGRVGRAGRENHSTSSSYVADAPDQPAPPYLPFSLPVLCESQEGYRNLCRLVTRMKTRAHAPGSPPRTAARWSGKG